MWLAILKLFSVLKDIKIYREYVKIIDKEAKDSYIWSRRKLRKDWFGRIYTVINLPPEVIFSNDLPKEARPSFVMSEIKPINDYLKSLNLEEILTLYMNPVKDTNDESYLVVYQYVFRELSWIWIFRFLIEVIAIILIVANWSWIISGF